jgi:predicted nucleic acid-binding protein
MVVAVVLDASVTASWYFPDEAHPVALRALEIVRREGAVVPQHWWFELLNAFLIGERRGRLSENETTEALSYLSRLKIEYASLPEHAAVLSLARKHRLSFYDAVYLELAQRTNLSLATLDRELAAAASMAGVPLVGPPA